MKNSKIYITRVLTLILFMATPMLTHAQHLEITPHVGYETGGKVATNLGYLRVDDGMNFGGTIGFGLDADAMIEFSYNHMNSELSLDAGEYNIKRTPVNVDYYMFGVSKGAFLGEKFLPYGGFSLGWVHYGTPEEEYGNESLFAINVSAGLKIQFNDWIGIRMQARLLMPLYWAGTYFYAGSGGTGYGVTSTCVMVQGDFSGGLVFVID
jgi:hypothetical protein